MPMRIRAQVQAMSLAGHLNQYILLTPGKEL